MCRICFYVVTKVPILIPEIIGTKVPILIPEELCAGYASTRQLKRTYGCRRVHYYICVLLYVSLYCYRCVLVLPYMCPHTTTYVSSYYYICVLVLPHFCPRTATYVSSYYYMRPLILHFSCCICVFVLLHVSAPTIRVLILLHMCPHTTIYVSSYCCICVLILPHVSSYYYICVLILQFTTAAPSRAAPLVFTTTCVFPATYTTTYVSSYSNLPQVLLDELHLSFFADGWYYREGVVGGGKSPLRESYGGLRQPKP